MALTIPDGVGVARLGIVGMGTTVVLCSDGYVRCSCGDEVRLPEPWGDYYNGAGCTHIYDVLRQGRWFYEDDFQKRKVPVFAWKGGSGSTCRPQWPVGDNADEALGALVDAFGKTTRGLISATNVSPICQNVLRALRKAGYDVIPEWQQLKARHVTLGSGRGARAIELPEDE